MPPINPDRQRSARARLAGLFAEPARVNLIHYACQSLVLGERHGSPRVTAVAIRNLESGAVQSCSIHAEAELARLGPVQVLSRLDQLERAMLDKVFDVLRASRQMLFVHWNMRDEVFGFAALELRYALLGGSPVSVPETSRVDLSRLLADIYGPRYVAPPHFETLARLNELPIRGMLAGRDEADAFERGEYAAVKRSTLVKVRVMFDVLQLAHDDVLVTRSPDPPTLVAAGGPLQQGRGRHAFISHANVDGPVAAEVVRLLEAGGTTCWIAPRDVPLGEDYQRAIVEAIDSMDAMILLLSEAANTSPHVAREVNLADEEGKPVFTLCLERARPRGSLRYQLNNRQWADVGGDLAGTVAHLRRFLA